MPLQGLRELLARRRLCLLILRFVRDVVCADLRQLLLRLGIRFLFDVQVDLRAHLYVWLDRQHDRQELGFIELDRVGTLLDRFSGYREPEDLVELGLLDDGVCGVRIRDIEVLHQQQHEELSLVDLTVELHFELDADKFDRAFRL